MVYHYSGYKFSGAADAKKSGNISVKCKAGKKQPCRMAGLQAILTYFTRLISPFFARYSSLAGKWFL